MKNNIFKLAALSFGLVFVSIVGAQDFQGTASYFSKTNANIDFDSPGMDRRNETTHSRTY